MDRHKTIALYQAKWLLGQGLALVALLSVFSLELGAERIGFLGISIAGASLLYPHCIEWIPSFLRKLLVGVLVVFVVMDFLRSGTDFIPPLARMIIGLLIFRLAEYRSRREDLQLVLLSLFLVISTGVLSMELSFAFQIVVYCPLAMITLFAITLDEGNQRMREVPEKAFSSFQWKPFFLWIRETVDRRLLLFSTGLFFAFALMASGLFVALPRFEFGQSLPFMRLQTSSSLSGFSDLVRFGEVVDIQKDDRVALRVDIPSGRPDRVPYWRMVALDEYFFEGFRQSLSSRAQNRIYASNHFERGNAADLSVNKEAAWVFYLEDGVSRYLPIPGGFHELKFQSRQEVEFNSLLDLIQMKETPASVLFYQLSPVALDEYATGWGRDRQLDELNHPLYTVVGTESTPSSLQYPKTLVALPDDGTTQMVLAKSLDSIRAAFGEWKDVSAFGFYATQWLQSKHDYALQTDLPGGEGNRIVRWIESDHAGHCELFAGSLIFLAREAGIPARMVNGFQGGDWNGYENYYMVRNLHAHAWVELYDRTRGWIRVDPTPLVGGGNSRDGLRSGLLADRTMSAYLDSLRVVWYRRVVNFDQAQQRDLAKGIQDQLKNLLVPLKSKVRSVYQTLKDWVRHPVRSDGWWKLPLYALFVILSFLTVKRLYRYMVESVYSEKRRNEYWRKRAEHLLFQLRGMEQPLNAMGEGYRKDLLTIRYGRETDWKRPPELFRSVKQYLRKAKWGF